MYYTGCQDYKCKFDRAILHQIEQSFCEEPSLVNTHFSDLANEVMRIHALDPPSDYQDALMNFFILTESITNLLNE